MMAPALVLALAVVLASACCCSASTQYDTSQDWISGIIAQGPGSCYIPGPIRPLPAIECPLPSRVLTDADWTRLGQMMAPIVYMHPRDWSFLADPKKWIENTPVYIRNHSDSAESYVGYTLEGLYEAFGDPANGGNSFVYDNVVAPNAFASRLFGGDFNSIITTDDIKRIGAGDPIGADNVSTAKNYFTGYFFDRVHQSSGILTWHHYWPDNGCSNQLFGLNIDGKYQGIEYYMCTPGTHEGDWERISALFCSSDAIALLDGANATMLQAPIKIAQRMQYSQHGWQPEYDCASGECPYQTDPEGILRPVAYAGLFSHAFYPQASPLDVYEMVNVSFIMNVNGMYIADRTAGGGPVFYPTPENTLFIPPVNGRTNRKEWRWADFPGSWGGFYTTSNQTSLTCFFNNFTAEAPCNATNPAFFFVNATLTKVGFQMVNSVDDLQWFANHAELANRGSSITGPLFRAFTYDWLPQTRPPVAGRNVSCPFSGDPTVTEHPEGYSIRSPQGLGVFIGVILALMIGAGVIYTLMLFFPSIKDKDLEVRMALLKAREAAAAKAASTVPAAAKYSDGSDIPDGVEASAESKHMIRDVWYSTRNIVWLVFAACSYITGLTLTIIGISDLLYALNEIYQDGLWNSFRIGFIVIVSFFGFFQLCIILIVLFIRSQPTVVLFGNRYRNPIAKWRRINHCGYCTQALLNGLIVIEINVTVVVFAVGFGVWVARYLFQLGCNVMFSAFVSAVDFIGDVCLDLTAIGLPRENLCGSQLSKVCSAWSNLQVQYLVWGSYLFILSHLMFLASMVHNMQMLVLDEDYPRGTTSMSGASGAFAPKSEAEIPVAHPAAAKAEQPKAEATGV